MDTTTLTKQPKKRGPAPKLGRLVDTHIHVDPVLLDWAKQQPEGFAGLVRRLLKEAYARETAQTMPPPPSLRAATTASF